MRVTVVPHAMVFGRPLSGLVGPRAMSQDRADPLHMERSNPLPLPAC